MKGNIPADWGGETWTEFCVPCPDSDEWRAALIGAIYALTRGRRWSADSGTIVDAQTVGREILQGMVEGCCMDTNPIVGVVQDACEVTFTYLDETTETVDIGDCPPTLIRKSELTGALVYWSGGEWTEINAPAGEPVPDPGDPRFQGGDWETPTPGTGIDIVCRSADAMMKELQQAAGDLVDEVDWNAAAWESTFTIFNTGLSTVAGLFSGFATGNAALGLGIGLALHAYLQSVAEEFLGLANLYTLLEAEDLADPLNSNWTDMRCLLYCNLNDDGQIDYEGHLALLEDIDAEIGLGHSNSDWYEFMRPIVEMAGTDALNAAYGTYGSTEDDCTACACLFYGTVFFDGDAGDLPYVAASGGTVQAGTGRDGTFALREVLSGVVYAGVAPQIDLGQSRNVVRVDFWSYLNGPEGGRRNVQISSSDDGTNWTQRYAQGGYNPGAGWEEKTYSPATPFAARYIMISVGEGGTGTYDARIDSIEIMCRG